MGGRTKLNAKLDCFMQIQCPKCKEWTDCEKDQCTVCGARLNQDGTQSDDQDEHNPQILAARSCSDANDIFVSRIRGKFKIAFFLFLIVLIAMIVANITSDAHLRSSFIIPGFGMFVCFNIGFRDP